jgi:hypothetical protein
VVGLRKMSCEFFPTPIFKIYEVRMNYKDRQERVVYGKSRRVYDTQKHILQLQKQHFDIALKTPEWQELDMSIYQYPVM